MKITRRTVWQKSRLEQKPRENQSLRSGRIIAAPCAEDPGRLYENSESVAFVLEISLQRASFQGLLNLAGNIKNGIFLGFEQIH